MSIFNFPSAAKDSGLINLSSAAARTSTVTGTGVDISGYTGNLLVLQEVGTVSGTSPTLDGKQQESSDDSNYTDISGATYTQVTASNSKQSIVVTADGSKKFLRWVGTIAGTTPSFIASVTAMGFKATV